MNIETRLGIGSRVFFMAHNAVKEGVIGKVTILATRTTQGYTEVSASYHVMGGYRDEVELFESKEALLASL